MASITCQSQIGIPMGIRHMFSQTRLQPLPIPSSSLRRTLPFTLKIRVSPCFIERRRRLSLQHLGMKCFQFTYEMLTVKATMPRACRQHTR